MQINRNTFANFTPDLTAGADTATIQILTLLRQMVQRFIKNPASQRRLEQEYANRLLRISDDWSAVIDEWIQNRLPKAYLLGIEESEKVVADFGARVANDPIRGEQVFGVGIETAPLSAVAKKILEDYPEHWTLFSTFTKAANDELGSTVYQITREANDLFRKVAIEAGNVTFRTADELTRVQLTQDMLNRFADRGITAIRYKNGAKVAIENYAEMVGRTMSGNAARQASLNRYSEYGYNLVRMSSHARSSPQCYPWQGGVYSQSGKSDKYPPLSEATGAGAFHPNCLHSLSPYFPGTSEPLETKYDPGEQKLINKYGEKKGTKIAYEASQQQRYNERMIRKWKKRDATAISKAEKAKAGKKIRQWQARQREHLDEFDFLPRKYKREQIRKAH